MRLTSSNQVQMQTATSMVKNLSGSSSASVRMILDSGSQRTYVTEKLAKNLQLQLNSPERLSMVTFGTEKPKYLQYMPSKLQLILKDGNPMVLDVSVVPSITGRITRTPLGDDDTTFLKSEGWESKLADMLPVKSDSSPVEMLIGNDYYFDLLLPRKMDLRPGLCLFQSRLGWILGGRCHTENSALEEPTLLIRTVGIPPMGIRLTTHMLTTVDSSLLTKPNLDRFWNLESLGIADSPVISDDDQAIDHFNKTVQFVEGRYMVTWPWKDQVPDLPQNYQLAVGRLRSTLQKLLKSPALLEQYDDIIQEQLRRGIIERVTDSSEEGSVKHYISHHPVITPSKSTTKVRIVYNASAKTRKDDLSLNDCLYRGPVMLPSLYGLLIRFRIFPIGIVADIEKAFLNVGLQNHERDVTRFLWLKNPVKPTLDSNLQVYRFCRVPFGVISSPFLLGATIAYHLRSSDNPIARVLEQDIYVDNLITGANTLEEAKSLYAEGKHLFETASMNLREWASNCEEFMKFVPQQHQAVNPNQKVLGVYWNLNDDTMSIPMSNVEAASTKREVLQRIGSIFDPLGYFSPTVLKAKVFMKKLWTDKCEWDEKINNDYLNEWNDISEQLAQISSYCLPRYIGTTEKSQAGEYRLVCFCDASAIAYATAIYLHQSFGDTYKADLIFSKTRLALVGTTIPRLELLGVLIGITALKFVQKELHLQVTCYVFTDSLCVLYWLKTSKPLSVFVTNRIKEIRSLKEAIFNHVSSEDNPADLAIRGKSPQELSLSIWWNGPTWLRNPIQQWPDSKLPKIEASCQQQLETEIKGSKILFEAKLISGEDLSQELPRKPTLSDIDEKRYSSLLRLLRVTAWVLRFINNLIKRDAIRGMLTVQELDRAKLLWELYIQQKHYSDVIDRVKRGKSCNMKSQLNLRLDDNSLLRCHGRFQNADLTQGAKFPKLLPSKEHFTKLVIEYYHKKILHSGVSQTLAQIRHEYWIPQGRAQIKRVLKNCSICRRTEGRPFLMPEMPPLPRERVVRSLPFEYTGLDYFGSPYIKQFVKVSDEVTETVSKKVWVCLFTCLAVRAIHLELVEDMSAREFIMCLRRFMARRGVPCQVISDNARQFKVAKTTLNKAWSNVVTSTEVNDYAVRQGIQWKFIVELAPWMGGFY